MSANHKELCVVGTAAAILEPTEDFIDSANKLSSATRLTRVNMAGVKHEENSSTSSFRKDYDQEQFKDGPNGQSVASNKGEACQNPNTVTGIFQNNKGSGIKEDLLLSSPHPFYDAYFAAVHNLNADLELERREKEENELRGHYGSADELRADDSGSEICHSSERESSANGNEKKKRFGADLSPRHLRCDALNAENEGGEQRRRSSSFTSSRTSPIRRPKARNSITPLAALCLSPKRTSPNMSPRASPKGSNESLQVLPPHLTKLNRNESGSLPDITGGAASSYVDYCIKEISPLLERELFHAQPIPGGSGLFQLARKDIQSNKSESQMTKANNGKNGEGKDKGKPHEDTLSNSGKTGKTPQEEQCSESPFKTIVWKPQPRIQVENVALPVHGKHFSATDTKQEIFPRETPQMPSPKTERHVHFNTDGVVSPANSPRTLKRSILKQHK